MSEGAILSDKTSWTHISWQIHLSFPGTIYVTPNQGFEGRKWLYHSCISFSIFSSRTTKERGVRFGDIVYPESKTNLSS